MSTPPSPTETRSLAVIAFVALVASAFAMGVSPVFVRIAGVGPFTSAFYRVLLALPLLWIWAWWSIRTAATPVDRRWSRADLLAGLFFALDLFFWHLSIFHTTIANATLLSCMAPVWVMLFSLVIGEKVTRVMVLGLGLCVAGAVALVGSSWQLAPERLLGDLYGVGTSLGFGLYFLAVRVARRTAPAAVVLARSTVVTAAVLAVVAALLENAWMPATIGGVAALVAMAAISHVGGQGMLAFALGHLSAAFSSLVIFLEALAGALFGWIFFSEHLDLWQIVGGLAILAGIWVARPRETRPPEAAE